MCDHVGSLFVAMR